MAGTRAAIRYAKAILDLANSKVAEAVDTDMKSIASISSNEELNTFIQNPTTRVEVKALLEILLALMELLKVCFIYYLRISVLKF
jgi:F-type H+-transporting ATPase subunit delta